ncbi:M35 family metallo-endopeptidase [Paraburkholderia sp. RL17-381-BIF-C]|jgi:hypothetical protein|uniref:M35 family metallo-endopeptidase n=1 Tax=Paraburkholderia sp. RL17-381-BIF-C TaxID=3031635 RepID=UPI0038BA6F6B
MSDYEYVTLHDSAVTNTNPNSNVNVLVDMGGPPICENMTDAQFRVKVLTLRDEAVKVIAQRLQELSTWQPAARERVGTWFGTSDETTRTALMNGLVALVSVMKILSAKNFIRPSPERDRALGCKPNTKNLAGEVAHVCAPDTATHTIAIDPGFCVLPDRSAGTLASKQLTLVHECTHFIDTFGSLDYKNTYGQFLGRRLAKDEPGMALKNADNIAWYVLCTD